MILEIKPDIIPGLLLQPLVVNYVFKADEYIYIYSINVVNNDSRVN